MESGKVKAEQRQQPVTPTPMESGEVKAEPRQQPVTPTKRRRPTKPKKSALANGGSSSSAAESSSLSNRTSSSSSPPSDDADGKGQQQQQQHQQGGGGKKPRLVWTEELHHLFVEAYDSLGDEAVPMKILEKMNEKMNLPEVSREKVASHLQKHKINTRREAGKLLGVEASSHSPNEEAPASHPQRPLPPNTTTLAEVSQAQLELVQHQQVLQAPPDCLSRSSSSIAANLQILQSIQQRLCGPPISEAHAQPAEAMQGAPVDSGCSLVGMETSTAAILVPEANTEAVIRMAQAAKAKNAAEPEAAPVTGILGQFWASPDTEASTSSWDIFGLSPGT